MSKIKKIKVVNLKAVAEQELDLNGCSVIVTGANRKGKTTVLSGLTDRIRGEKPDIILREGTHDGISEMELTTGEKFVWTLANDKVTFITKEGFKTPCTKEIAKRFFPELFDIDEFLHQQPKQQAKTLQIMLGIDMTAIDLQYKSAYEDRTYANRKRDEARAALQAFSPIPEKCERIDVSELMAKKEAIRADLNKKYLANKAINDKLRSEYNTAYESALKANQEWNTRQSDRQKDIEKATQLLNELLAIGYMGNEVSTWIKQLPKPEALRNEVTIQQPAYIAEMPDDAELKAIDSQIASVADINEAAARYQSYLSQKKELDALEKAAKDADTKVKEIEKKKKDMIKSAKLPEGFEITDDGIMVDGFPLTNSQVSTSQKYISALKLAFISIGEVRSMHFDASTLDKISLKEVEEWAGKNDLQLLIEKPDFDGGEISYQFISELK